MPEQDITETSEEEQRMYKGDLVEVFISTTLARWTASVAPKKRFGKMDKTVFLQTNVPLTGIVVDKYRKSKQYKGWADGKASKVKIAITVCYHVLLADDIIFLESNMINQFVGIAREVGIRMKLIQSGNYNDRK